MQITPLTFKEFEGTSVAAATPRSNIFSSMRKKEEEPPAPPPPPTFSEEELNAAKRDSYQNGFLDGTKEGINQTQSEQADVEKILMERLENFIQHIKPVFSQHHTASKQMRMDMPVLALAIAKKVAKVALLDNHEAIIEEAAKHCLDAIITESKVTITINEKLAGVLSEKIKKLAVKENAASNIEITATPNVLENDYIIEWKNGSLERSSEKIWQLMDKAIDDMLATISNEKEAQMELL